METAIKTATMNIEGSNTRASETINLTITLSPEKMARLKNEIRRMHGGYEEEFIERLIESLSETHNTFKNVEPLTELESAVTEVMNYLGIPAQTKGYRYLRDAIVLTTENPDFLDQITKELYPAIARSHNTTPVRVERVIRHAIEYCCLKGNEDAVCSLFSHCLASKRGKPTNSEFIAVMSDRLRMNA